MNTAPPDGSGEDPRESGGKWEANELVQLLTENVDDLILLRDPTGRVAYASSSVERYYGCVPKTLSELISEFFHPDNGEAFRKWWEKVLAGESKRHHWRVRDAAGNDRWLETTPAVVRHHGRPHVLTVCRDITERKVAEEERRKQAEVLQKIFDNAPIGINFFAEDGRLLLANRAWERIFGWTLQELRDEGRDIYAEATPDSEEERRAHEFVTKAAGEWSDFRIRRRDGRVVVVSGTVVLLSDGTRIALSYDVTERRRVEGALRAAEDRLRHVVVSSPAVLFTLPVEDGRFRGIGWMSDNVETLLGYRVEETLGADWWMGNIHPEDREAVVERFLSEIFARKHVVSEYRFRHKDGRYRWILGESRLLGDADGQPTEVVGSLSDITERKELEDQFRHAQKMEAIGHLAGGVAHDFNNLLGVILMSSEFAERAEGLPASAMEDLQQIRTAATRAANLTRQLLLFSSRQVIQSAELNVNDVVINIAKMLQRIIGEEVRLQLQLNPTPLFTWADAGMMDQVLVNLAINARDAMPAGGRLAIETSARTIDEDFAALHPEATPGHYVCLSVSDTGTGIPPEVMSRIFEPFFTTKPVGKGTGLGLATVYGIVKQHRGWLQVFSEPGDGTNFQVFFPAIDASAAETSKTLQKQPPRGSETVLLVEDEPLFRFTARMVLERAGYRVVEATNGVEALQMWEEHRGEVALLLTDLVLPQGIRGQELARRLREQSPQLKVLFTSGYSAEIAGHQLTLCGGETFLQKPFSHDQLLETVHQCLRGN
jgi:PAS domain S-box-containing protein